MWVNIVDWICVQVLLCQLRIGSQYMLSQGQSNSWLLGNVIITITVSGCAVHRLGTGGKRYQSEQSQGVNRKLELVVGEVEVVQLLIRDDNHVCQR